MARAVMPENLINQYFKDKLDNMDSNFVAKCVVSVTKANVEELVVENTPFGDEAISTTNPKDTEHVMPEEDDAPTTEQSNE